MTTKKVGQSDTVFLLGAMAAFLALSLTTLLLHEPWRDEFHSWMIACTSASFGELQENCRYEPIF